MSLSTFSVSRFSAQQKGQTPLYSPITKKAGVTNLEPLFKGKGDLVKSKPRLPEFLITWIECRLLGRKSEKQYLQEEEEICRKYQNRSPEQKISALVTTIYKSPIEDIEKDDFAKERFQEARKRLQAYQNLNQGIFSLKSALQVFWEGVGKIASRRTRKESGARLEERILKEIKAYLDTGGDISKIHYVGGSFPMSPLAGAATYGRLPLVELLLGLGAKVDFNALKNAVNPIRTNNAKKILNVLLAHTDLVPRKEELLEEAEGSDSLREFIQGEDCLKLAPILQERIDRLSHFTSK